VTASRLANRGETLPAVTPCHLSGHATEPNLANRKGAG
jgi:hypothetical protein